MRIGETVYGAWKEEMTAARGERVGRGSIRQEAASGRTEGRRILEEDAISGNRAGIAEIVIDTHRNGA